MDTDLRIAWVTAELAPYSKVGGLADVSAALPKELHRQDVDIRIILPYYTEISADYEIEKLGYSFTDFRGDQCELYATKLVSSEVTVYLLKHTLFSGEPYDGDLGMKFATFSWLVSRLFDQIQWYPDIVHANDWHTAPIVPILDQIPVSTVFTIHNLAYQGVENSQYLLDIGLEEYIEDHAVDVNYMKLGIEHADQVTTVSSTYADEIQTSEFGFGLEDILQNHSRDIVGIVHGIDTDEYDPVTDIHITEQYSKDNLDDKYKNKLALQKKAGLTQDTSYFTIGTVSRLVHQKGINILAEIIPVLVDKSIQIIILGTGDEKIEHELQRLQYAYPENVQFFMTYNEPLSHQMFAGLDAIVIPSRYEPCGLTQLYAMAYGTVPIVRRTGGLADTVSEESQEQTGFVFEEPVSNQLYQTIIRAHDIYIEDKERWREIQLNDMEQELNWEKPGKEWLRLYHTLE